MPFAKTAYVGDKEENILHYNAVRIHANGTGALKQKLFSLDEQDFNELEDLIMAVRTDVQPTSLANFIHQRASVEIRTLTINEWFKINRIILFVGFYASEYPG